MIAPSSEQSLVLEDVRIALQDRELLRLTTTILPGEVFTLMGPSGSGKSTLLAYVGGFLAPVFQAGGKVLLSGEEITGKPAHLRRTGILFQDPLLFPHLSIGQNLLFAVPETIKGTERHDRVMEKLRNAGLEGFYDRDPATLSGGQQARAALMRLLLSEPKALLLDEPFSKLDTGLRQQIRELVFTQVQEEGLPTILVTHDEEDARAANGALFDLEDNEQTCSD